MNQTKEVEFMVDGVGVHQVSCIVDTLNELELSLIELGKEFDIKGRHKFELDAAKFGVSYALKAMLNIVGTHVYSSDDVPF